MGQLPLFGTKEALAIDASFASMERLVLTPPTPSSPGAWLDVARGWLRGDAQLFDHLRDTVAWRTESRVMYERTVAVPRLYAVLDAPSAVHPILPAMRAALDARYGVSFDRLSVALYRDGKDSVAWHGDYVARRMRDALVATISLAAPRRFLVRPKGGGASIALSLGWGDLVVMGGTCQRTHEHAIPKVAKADPRLVVMFRPTWDEADPDPAPTDEQDAYGKR